MTQKQNPKFKIKEFEWFQMQTKVRQIIQQVLGPLQKRILQNGSIVNKVKADQAEDSKKIQEIILMVANDPKVFQTGIFHTVQTKFETQSKKIEQLSRQIQQQHKYVDQKFKIVDTRMQQSSEVLQNVAAMRQRVSKEMQLQNDNINSIRTNLQAMIYDLNSDIRQLRTNSQKNLQKCEKQEFSLNQKIIQINLQISSIQETLKSHNQLHRNENCKLQIHSEELKRHQKDIQGLQDSKLLTKRLSDRIKQLQNQIKKYDFKTTTITPLITMAQISQCLYYVLPQKMKKRIAIHQFKKYFKLNRDVLEKDYSTITQTFHGLDLLEQMQKRSTKEIVQMKRKKLLSMGVDIDHLSFQQRQQYYNQLVLDDNFIEEDQQVRVTAKVDQKQVLNIITKYFKSYTDSLTQKINIEMGDSKQYLLGIQQQMQQQLTFIQNKIRKLEQKIQTYQTNHILQSKHQKSEISSIKKNYEDTINQIEQIKTTQKALYNFCSLVNHLQIQDEIDKQSISLMGIQESNVDQPSNKILNIDKKCFSCCGYPATTMNAFKMACLAYSPSPIVIDNVHYKRQQLLQFTLNVLQGIKKTLQSSPNQLQKEQNNSSINLNSDNIQLLQQEQASIVDDQKQKKSQTAARFRKTIGKKHNSTNKNLSKSVNRNSLRSDMVNVSIAFRELRQKNLTFLV